MQDSFAKAVIYRTYWLKNKSQRYSSKIALKIAKLGKKLRPQLKETNFDEMDPSSILVFLKKFCDACGSVSMHEGAATGLVSYFMKKPASPSLEARLLT